MYEKFNYQNIVIFWDNSVAMLLKMLEHVIKINFINAFQFLLRLSVQLIFHFSNSRLMVCIATLFNLRYGVCVLFRARS